MAQDNSLFFFEALIVTLLLAGIFFLVFALAIGIPDALLPSCVVGAFAFLFYVARLVEANQRIRRSGGKLSHQFGTRHALAFQVPMAPRAAFNLMVSYLQESYKKYKPRNVDDEGFRLIVVNKMKWFDSRNIVTIEIVPDGKQYSQIRITSRPIFAAVLFDGGSNARIMNEFEDFLAEHGKMLLRSSSLF